MPAPCHSVLPGQDLLDDLLTEMEVAVLDTHDPVTPIIGGVYMAKVGPQPTAGQVPACWPYHQYVAFG